MQWWSKIVTGGCSSFFFRLTTIWLNVDPLIAATADKSVLSPLVTAIKSPFHLISSDASKIDPSN